MFQIQKAVTGIFVPAPSSSKRAAEETYVIGVSLQFDTTTNDKDPDTLLDISVFNHKGTLIAQKIGVSGHWNDHSSTVVALDLKNALGRSKVPSGRVDLAIHPNGNDKWEFNYHIDIFFSADPNGDNEVVERAFNGKVLTQDSATSSDGFTS
jgi:hypothetical protein